MLSLQLTSVVTRLWGSTTPHKRFAVAPCLVHIISNGFLTIHTLHRINCHLLERFMATRNLQFILILMTKMIWKCMSKGPLTLIVTFVKAFVSVCLEVLNGLTNCFLKGNVSSLHFGSSISLLPCKHTLRLDPEVQPILQNFYYRKTMGKCSSRLHR